MSKSNRFLFNPDLAEMVDEAFERIGIDPADVTSRHINSARRSMNFMLQHWATKGVHAWAVERAQQNVTVGMETFVMPKGALDIVTATLKRQGFDTPMYPISREDYQNITDKDHRGRPDRYFVDREIGQNTVYIWQAGSNSTDILEYWYFRQLQDAGSFRNTLDIPSYFYEAFVAGLASGLAEKYQPERLAEKRSLYMQCFSEALIEDGSRAPLAVSVSYSNRR